ncbi:CBS domain-containing protein [Arachidicoccus rhizosphaerae]|uniref:CBS domain-containing protein n=1 Tax=Arachidicoccus rhizosphaerae TaxID=551991 RepID=A0A1H4CCC1_9BACT|nr:CBS domain-containing protein [Arachidicoccus rhizosphaerae]SEA58016.1 CBS domain-containing protein [Arachidicoccus rhizosphaerae]
MKTVQFILNQKPDVLYSVTSDSSVYHALELMMDKNISALLVMREDSLEGIFTERDYARKVILQGKASKTTSMQEVMTSQVITVSPSEPVEKCMAIMTDRHIRHLPVEENGKIVGFISIGDLVRHVIEDQKSTIEHLQSYISS